MAKIRHFNIRGRNLQGRNGKGPKPLGVKSEKGRNLWQPAPGPSPKKGCESLAFNQTVYFSFNYCLVVIASPGGACIPVTFISLKKVFIQSCMHVQCIPIIFMTHRSFAVILTLHIGNLSQVRLNLHRSWPTDRCNWHRLMYMYIIPILLCKVQNSEEYKEKLIWFYWKYKEINISQYIAITVKKYRNTFFLYRDTPTVYTSTLLQRSSKHQCSTRSLGKLDKLHKNLGIWTLYICIFMKVWYKFRNVRCSERLRVSHSCQFTHEWVLSPMS